MGPAQPQKLARGLKFQICRLICAFVIGINRFSHDMAQFINTDASVSSL